MASSSSTTGSAGLADALGFQKSARRIFHDIEYVIAISGDSDNLSIEVEQADNGLQWKAKFQGKFIEDVTQRSGNSKRFDVFVKMLLSALAQESDSVFLDVLTNRDLEMLRHRANPQGPPMTTNAVQLDKRYFILTYHSQFDKVHYPLPLLLEERSEQDALRSTVARLRGDLEEARQKISALELQGNTAEKGQSGTAGELDGLKRENAELQGALAAARRENEQLRAEARMREATGSGDTAEVRRLLESTARQQSEIRALKEEAKNKQKEHKRELDNVVKELQAERKIAQQRETQLRRLEDEKRAMGSKLRSASRSPSRPPSRTPSQPPSRPASRPGSRPGSANSSLDGGDRRGRVPSPSAFLGGRGRTPERGSTQSSSAADGKPWAAKRSNSPYSKPMAPPPRQRTPSPSRGMMRSRDLGGPPSRDRTPSPQGRRASPSQRSSPAAGGGRRDSPASVNALDAPTVGSGASGLRERPSSVGRAEAARSHQNLVPVLSGRKVTDASPVGGKPTSSRYGGSGVRTSTPTRAASPHAQAAARMVGAMQMGPTQSSQASYPAPAAVPAAVPRPGSTGPAAGDEGCDIDARLAALQNFLRQTKSVGA